MDKTTVSLPMQGEWIEIFALDPSQAGRGSLPMQGEWIEIFFIKRISPHVVSLPMQGEWIEIPAPVRSSARP